MIGKLDAEQLKKIADSEGIRYPASADKAFLSMLVGGVLSYEKVKEYVVQYTEEEIERETTVKEKIRRTVVRTSLREVKRIDVPKEKMIVELTKAKISKTVIEQIAEYYRSRFEFKKNMVELLELLSDGALAGLYTSFCEMQSDPQGRFFEWRMGEYIHDKNKIETIKFRQKIVGRDGVPYDIDVAGFNSDGKLVAIAECKSRGGSPTKEDVTKWLAATEQISKAAIGESVRISRFASISPYTQDVIKLVKGRGGDNGDLRVFNPKGMLKGFLANSDFRTTVAIGLLEEREGNVLSIYPK